MRGYRMGFVRKREWSWIDAYYGTAAYLPMADGARYVVTVTQSSLIGRPANEAAQKAVGARR